MSIITVLEHYMNELSMTTDKTSQLDKIYHYYSTDDVSSVCHYYTGNAIKRRSNDEDKIVLCGRSDKFIDHSFLVDSFGVNLIPESSGYINPDIELYNTDECTIKGKGMIPGGTTYPYVEIINVSDFFKKYDGGE